MNSEYYTPIEQQHDKHIVIPDLHGESKLLDQVIDKYHDDQTRFVFLGDIIDQKGIAEEDNNTKNIFESIKELGNLAVMTMANHEFVMQGGLFAKKPEIRDHYSTYWNMISQNTFEAYSLKPSIRDDHEAMGLLKLAMDDLAHIAVLRSTVMYYETDKFIATHAGLEPKRDWLEQRDQLDKLAIELGNDKFPDYGGARDLPTQIFAIENAMGAEKIEGTDKITLSGHAHYLTPESKRFQRLNIPISGDRVLHNGTKIRLASQVNFPSSQDLYIWKDWDQEIDIIPNPSRAIKTNEIETV